jgi:hypothetical protein
MAKTVTLKAKPQSKNVSPEQWVSGADARESEAKTSSPESPGAMKRLTIDIPEELHTRVKMQCAARGRKMADEIRVLLEENFPPG